MGNAVLDGCKKLRERFLKVAATMLQSDARQLDIEDGIVFSMGLKERGIPFGSVIAKAFATQVPLSAVGSWYPPMTYPNAINQGDKMHTYTFGAQAAIVAVDVETGEITVEDTVLACDVGKAINPDTVEGQMHGAMAQAISWTLMEEHFMKNGKMSNFTYHDYLIPTAMDLPNLRTIIVEHPNCLGPYGARGIGEPPIVGAAPAIRNAVLDATGIYMNQIPLTPVRVMDAIRQKKAAESC